MPQVTPYYAAVLALMYIALSAQVIGDRRRHLVALGGGGIDSLERRIRVHGNFAEYVPLTLLLILMDELRGLPSLAVHALCLCLLIGRLAHAWGVSEPKRSLQFRVGGMMLTFIALGLAAAAVPMTALL